MLFRSGAIYTGVNIVDNVGGVSTYALDVNTRLATAYIDANANQTNFGYTNNILLSRSQTVSGSPVYSASLTYDTKLWVPTKSADGNGNITSFQYDANANLTTLTQADGSISTYGYEGTGLTRRLIQQTDPLGNVTKYAYNANWSSPVSTHRKLANASPSGRLSTKTENLYTEEFKSDVKSREEAVLS